VFSWLQELLKHDGVAAAIVSSIGAIALALIAWVSGAGKWVGEQIGKALEHRRQQAPRVARLPKKTMLVAEDLTMVHPNYWHIDQYDASGPATGFRALLLVSRLVPYPIEITAVEARLPWRLRIRKHRVAHAMFQAFVQRRGSPQERVVDATEAASVNFYVKPPIREDRPIAVTVRIRDKFLNWHRRKITFHRSPA